VLRSWKWCLTFGFYRVSLVFAFIVKRFPAEINTLRGKPWPKVRVKCSILMSRSAGIIKRKTAALAIFRSACIACLKKSKTASTLFSQQASEQAHFADDLMQCSQCTLQVDEMEVQMRHIVYASSGEIAGIVEMFGRPVSKRVCWRSMLAIEIRSCGRVWTKFWRGPQKEIRATCQTRVAKIGAADPAVSLITYATAHDFRRASIR
ncbi:hypothetical protein WDV93_11915, partial [Pantoea ananatis]